MIHPDTIEKVKDAARIEEVVGDWVDLKPAGVNFKACCPFHSERTPSFNVHPARNIFKCFGCGEGGDSITFLMKKEGKTYPEAILLLAKKYNIEVKETQEKTDPQHDQKTLIRTTASVLQAHFALSKSDDTPGRKYWLERGLKPETLDEFGIGYCDGSKPPHVADSDLATLGVLNEKGNIFLYKRSVLPIHDAAGRVVAFAGRTIEKEKDGEKVMKYLNTGDTLIYKKSAVLFNLHRAAKHIRQTGEIWIVEGYADVMAAWQAGLYNVVALCGTALSDAQVALIKKFNGETPLKIILAFDNEITKVKAGEDRTQKVQVAMAYYVALEKLLPIGEVVRLEYPAIRRRHPKDVGELVQLGGNPEECEKKDALSDYVERKYADGDWGENASPVEKADFQEHIARLIGRVKRDSVRDIYVKQLYGLLEVTPKKLEELVKRYDTNEKNSSVVYDILEYEYIAVKDGFKQRIPERDDKTGEISWSYQWVKKGTITDQFGTAFIRTIPRFVKEVVKPNHLKYQRTIEIPTSMGSYAFFNAYEPLKFKPKPFELPAGFIADPYNYDYTTIPEIANVATLFKHIFDQGKNVLGDDYLQIAWDWLAIMYLFPEARLPCIGLVSKEEGTGKSTLINVFAKFFGSNTTKIDASRIAAKFNALMGGKILVYCEETKDDRGQMENILKDLITGFEMIVEKKFGDAEVMPTFCKFLLASNHPETFMKVGTATTRFFITQINPIPAEKKVKNMEELCYIELPYLAYFLEKRGVMCPDEDRLWMRPERYENEALRKLRQASKDVVEQNVEELMAQVFLKCELTDPVLYMTSSYLKELMIAYGGDLYKQKTPLYFQNVATRDMRLKYSDMPTKREIIELAGIHAHSWVNTVEWAYESKRAQGRFIEFPIWRFCTPSDIFRNYTPEKIDRLIAKLTDDLPRHDKTPTAAQWLAEINEIISTKSLVKTLEDIPF
jgi:DNA primase catalytic core